jgi:hypothetical protein
MECGSAIVWVEVLTMVKTWCLARLKPPTPVFFHGHEPVVGRGGGKSFEVLGERERRFFGWIVTAVADLDRLQLPVE